MTKSEQIKQVNLLLKNEKAVEAREAFKQIPEEESIEYLLLKGKMAQKFQEMGDAMNAYSKVLAIDPENVEAANSLHLIQNILNFWNPEMFNP